MGNSLVADSLLYSDNRNEIALWIVFYDYLKIIHHIRSFHFWKRNHFKYCALIICDPLNEHWTMSCTYFENIFVDRAKFVQLKFQVAMTNQFIRIFCQIGQIKSLCQLAEIFLTKKHCVVENPKFLTKNSKSFYFDI